MLRNELAISFSEVIPATMWMIRLEMRKLAKSKLTVSQFRILAQLSRGHQTNNQLSEMQGVSVASMSRMVNGLVKKGYILKSTGPSDRRQVELNLSPKGKKVFEALKTAAQTKFAQTFAALTEKEQEELNKGLHILKKISGQQGMPK